eukprot:TRINITY_DN6628_c0_g1_i1.p1 TRINITY_DN6628_c0_g1~~TRINITY_DN6628_c0_g1_i1.p1  ORF type:complete len:632 (-),score=135.12 TRINITY_DN6628_c0_g1_i1:346-2241(-)
MPSKVSMLAPLLGALQPTEAQDTPGFQFLGFGYDILTGNTRDTSGFGDRGFRTNVFDFKHDQGQKTPDGKWEVPDKTTSQEISACSETQVSKIVNSAFSYMHEVSTDFSIDLDMFDVAFDFSTDTKHITQTTETKESIFAQITATCAVYELTMHMYDHPPLDPNFLAGAGMLPSTVDEDEEAYMTFIHRFGTHVVNQMTLGGRWGWSMEFKAHDYQNLLDDSVSVDLGLHYAGKIKAGFDVDHSTDARMAYRVTKAISHNASFNTGGDFKTDQEEWKATVRNNPMPLSLQLTPLYDLFTPAYMPNVTNVTGKKLAMKDALKRYCPYKSKTSDPSVTCKAPEPQPMPQPHPLAPDAIHRVCLENEGGFALWWELINRGRPVEAKSETFTAGHSRCLDGIQANAHNGDVLVCHANIIAGRHGVPCEGKGYKFDERSLLQANYRCTGGTFSVSCTFTGLTRLGETPTQAAAVSNVPKAHAVVAYPSISMPKTGPALPGTIQKVCMQNGGGFALSFKLTNREQTASAQSDTFPAPETHCLDFMLSAVEMMLGAAQKLDCRVNIVAGKHDVPCEGYGGDYSVSSAVSEQGGPLQANYRCTGSTFTPSCSFIGLSQLGEHLDQKADTESAQTAVVIV